MKRSPIVIALSLILLAVAVSLARLGSTSDGLIKTPQVQASAAGASLDEPKVELLKPADFNKFKDTAKGKVLIVNFWATWCGPCVAEFPELVALDKKYRDKGVKLVGISTDEVSDLKTKVIPFIKEQKAAFEILLQDSDDIEAILSQIDKNWGGALPTTFIFDKQGTMAYTHYGIIDREQLVEAIEKALK